LSRTASQVARYLDCASSLWQDKFLGIRVLSLHEPARSVFISPDSTITALHLTAHLSKRSGVPRNGEQAEVHAHRPGQGDQGTG
jgi:hypothetical protein